MVPFGLAGRMPCVMLSIARIVMPCLSAALRLGGCLFDELHDFLNLVAVRRNHLLLQVHYRAQQVLVRPELCSPAGRYLLPFASVAAILAFPRSEQWCATPGRLHTAGTGPYLLVRLPLVRRRKGRVVLVR